MNYRHHGENNSGVHPSNRDGVGLGSDHCLSLIKNILDLGWLSPPASQLVCMEIPDGDQKIVQFNQELVAASEGRFPVYDLDNYVFDSCL